MSGFDIPPIWQLITVLLAIVGAAITITRYITRLEGRINVLQERLDNNREELNRQRNEFSEWRKLFTDTGFNAIAGRLKGDVKDG